MRSPLAPPMVRDRRARVASAAPPGRPPGRHALGHPGRRHGGGEDGVGTVDRPPSSCVEDHLDLGHLPGGQDPEGADGQVQRGPGRVDRDALGPDQAQGLVDRTDDVGTQGDRVEDLAGPDLDRDRAPARRARRRSRTVTAARPPPGSRHVGAAGARRRAPPPGVRRGRAGRPAPRPRRRPRSSSRHGRPGDVDLFDRPRRERLAHPLLAATQVGRARGPPDPHHARTVGPQRRGRAVVASVRSAPRPRGSTAPGPGSASSVGQGPGPGRDRAAPLAAEGAPVGQRRWPAGHRGGTSWRRARGTPAPPRSSAA